MHTLALSPSSAIAGFLDNEPESHTYLTLEKDGLV
jgi:hypothetical protein